MREDVHRDGPIEWVREQVCVCVCRSEVELPKDLDRSSCYSALRTWIFHKKRFSDLWLTVSVQLFSAAPLSLSLTRHTSCFMLSPSLFISYSHVHSLQFVLFCFGSESYYGRQTNFIWFTVTLWNKTSDSVFCTIHADALGNGLCRVQTLDSHPTIADGFVSVLAVCMCEREKLKILFSWPSVHADLRSIHSASNKSRTCAMQTYRIVVLIILLWFVWHVLLLLFTFQWDLSFTIHICLQYNIFSPLIVHWNAFKVIICQMFSRWSRLYVLSIKLSQVQTVYQTTHTHTHQSPVTKPIVSFFVLNLNCIECCWLISCAAMVWACALYAAIRSFVLNVHNIGIL